jgi:hypothetical protein
MAPFGASPTSIPKFPENRENNREFSKLRRTYLSSSLLNYITIKLQNCRAFHPSGSPAAFRFHFAAPVKAATSKSVRQRIFVFEESLPGTDFEALNKKRSSQNPKGDAP